VTLGQTGTGTTTLNSPTTNITGGGPTGSINIGLNLTNSNSALVLGNTSMGPIYIGQSATRGGNINIGTGGTGQVYVGNSTAPLTLSGSTTTFSSPITLGSAPSSAGTTGSAPYLGTYYFNNTIPAFANTASNLCTITISVPGVYIVTLGVQLQLTSSTPTNNYINALTSGMTTIGFSQVYSTWFQSANASFVVYVGTTYSATVNMNNASSSLISTNGITCQWGYVRIA